MEKKKKKSIVRTYVQPTAHTLQENLKAEQVVLHKHKKYRPIKNLCCAVRLILVVEV